MVGGITLGAAALLGAIAGGGAQTARHYGNRLLGKLKGQRELTVDDAVLRLLALRQRQLLAALASRGHAATEQSAWPRRRIRAGAKANCRRPGSLSGAPAVVVAQPGRALAEDERRQVLDQLQADLQHG